MSTYGYTTGMMLLLNEIGEVRSRIKHLDVYVKSVVKMAPAEATLIKTQVVAMGTYVEMLGARLQLLNESSQ
jgi:hypothetical protein